MDSSVPASRKFSIDALPGDTPSTRRTKQVARAIRRVQRLRGITAAELAGLVEKLQGEQYAVSSINGLFSGKRKALPFSELEAIAKALDVPLLYLLYPHNEPLEGSCVQGQEWAYTLVSAATEKVSVEDSDSETKTDFELAYQFLVHRDSAISHARYVVTESQGARTSKNQLLRSLYFMRFSSFFVEISDLVNIIEEMANRGIPTPQLPNYLDEVIDVMTDVNVALPDALGDDEKRYKWWMKHYFVPIVTPELNNAAPAS